MYSVLLVDDEPLAIEGLQLFVNWKQLGFRVCGVCENGEEALESIITLSPDVVVTDICMPMMDGLDLIGRLQSEKVTLPEFVVLSGYSEFAYAKRALQLGVRHYLMKPVIEEEASEVLRQVHGILEARRNSEKGWTTDQGEVQPPIEAIREVRGILEAVEALNLEEATRLIHCLFVNMADRSFVWMGALIRHLTIQCTKLIQELGGEPTFLKDRPETGAESELGMSKPEDIVSYIERVITAVQALQERRPGRTLAQIDRFIQEQYRSSLSIKQVAARFYLNPVYLGKAYQEKFGCSILDKIHDLRIEEARLLLRETDLNSGVIAEQVGYSHYNHFLQHFEKRLGIKPAEYRSMTS